MARTRKPSIRVEVDTSEFRDALRHFQELTGKDDTTVIVSAAIDTCFRAVAPTKSATPARLRATYPVNSDWSSVPYGKEKKAGPRLFYAMGASAGIKVSKQMAMKAWKRRDDARGYMKAHWLALAKVMIEDARSLGGKFLTRPGVKTKISAELMQAARKHLAHEFNVRRSVFKAVDFTVNTPGDAKPMMSAALDKGLAKAASDMVTNAHKKYVIAAKKVSAR